MTLVCLVGDVELDLPNQLRELEVQYLARRIGYHTPYWALRSAVGLPTSDSNKLVQLYRLFLIKATTSRLMTWVEDAILNRICPKSLVLYARKPA